MTGAIAATTPIGPGPATPFHSVLPLHELTWQTAADGTRFLLISPRVDASAARIHLTNFRVPVDAAVFMYGLNADGTITDIQGPFTGAGPAGTHEFWSQPVRGTAIIELQAGARILPDLPFEIAEVAPATPSPPAFSQTAAVAPETGLRTAWFRGRNVSFHVRNGIGIFEGDIEFGPVGLLEPARPESKETRREGVAIAATRYRWPGGMMPYVIDPAIAYSQTVLDAIAHWNEKLAGVVRIAPRTTEANYVQFKHNTTPVCSAYVGMLGYGMQAVNLSSACGFGATVHEIGHALGLFHEHSREDRDRHIRVLTENVSSNQAYNFAQSNATSDDLGSYDYASVMHYNAYAFSANGLPTIETIPAGIPIGQRLGLSSGDIEAVKALYGAPAAQPATVPITIASNPPGLRLTVDGAAVAAPHTAQWAPGSEHAISAPAAVFVNNTRHDFQRWSDAGERTHSIATPASPAMFTADYRRSHKLIASAAGEGNVSITPASADGYYAENSVVTLDAIPSPGSCFAGWTGLLGGTPASATLSVTKHYSVTANFVSGGTTLNHNVGGFSRWGGYVDITVNSPAGCGWDAVSEAPWVRIVGGTTGMGPSSMRIAVDVNPTATLRAAFVRIGSSVYVVVQSAF